MLKLELSEQMLMAIVQILRTAPISYNIAAPLLAELQKQVDAQTPKNDAQLGNGYERKTVVPGHAEMGERRP